MNLEKYTKNELVNIINCHIQDINLLHPINYECLKNNISLYAILYNNLSIEQFKQVFLALDSEQMFQNLNIFLLIDKDTLKDTLYYNEILTLIFDTCSFENKCLFIRIDKFNELRQYFQYLNLLDVIELLNKYQKEWINNIIDYYCSQSLKSLLKFCKSLDKRNIIFDKQYLPINLEEKLKFIIDDKLSLSFQNEDKDSLKSVLEIINECCILKCLPFSDKFIQYLKDSQLKLEANLSLLKMAEHHLIINNDIKTILIKPDIFGTTATIIDSSNSYQEELKYLRTQMEDLKVNKCNLQWEDNHYHELHK